MAEQVTVKGLSKRKLYMMLAGGLAVILTVSAVLTSWLTAREFEILIPRMTSGTSGENPILDVDAVIQNLQSASKAQAAERKQNRKLKEALKLIEAEEYAQAIPMLEDLREQLENSEELGPVIRSTLAELYYYTGQYNRCTVLCGDILFKNEDTEGFYSFMSAISKLQLADYDGAAEDLTNALDRGYTEKAMCYYFRGVTYLVQEQFETAMPDFKAALDAGYDKTECYYNYGICAYVAEQYEVAAEAFHTVVERNDDAEYTQGAQTLLDTLTE